LRPENDPVRLLGLVPVFAAHSLMTASRNTAIFVSLILTLVGLPVLSESASPARIQIVEGLQAPESVVYDAGQDVYFVSNINGEGTAKDNNGFISKISPEGKILTEKFVEGGSAGVILNAPKGITIAGDLLWVADIDAVRAFNRKTGAAVKTVDLQPLGALFLNDLVAAPDGTIYVTDTTLLFDASGNATHPGPDRVFQIPPNGKASVAIQDPSLGGPNGIVWDAAAGQFLIVQLEGKNIVSWKPGARTATVFATGVGSFDGIVILGGGQYLVTSLDTSSLYRLQDGEFDAVISGIENPADIALDSKRNRLLIPSFSLNHLEIWQL
jgi:sugar lactone lactonase YvrE